jgi:hypothetical protein
MLDRFTDKILEKDCKDGRLFSETANDCLTKIMCIIPGRSEILKGSDSALKISSGLIENPII